MGSWEVGRVEGDVRGVTVRIGGETREVGSVPGHSSDVTKGS